MGRRRCNAGTSGSFQDVGIGEEVGGGQEVRRAKRSAAPAKEVHGGQERLRGAAHQDHRLVGDVPPPEGDLSALSASLQSDARDAKVFFGVLCSTFETALPESTVVEREHSLFNKAKRVARRLTVELGDDTFSAEMHEGQLLCRQVHAVHGIHGGLPYTKAAWGRGVDAQRCSPPLPRTRGPAPRPRPHCAR